MKFRLLGSYVKILFRLNMFSCCLENGWMDGCSLAVNVQQHCHDAVMTSSLTQHTEWVDRKGLASLALGHNSTDTIVQLNIYLNARV